MSEKIQEHIKELEDRMNAMQINKHTQKSINYIKAQLAKLRDELITIASSKSGGGKGFAIKKSGDAQVAFIGFPSVGKSSLLNLLTGGNTDSKVASYDFTTLSAIPGMMEINQAKIQLIDLPGIILGAAIGKGRGKEILSAARSADLILIIICYKNDGKIYFNDLYQIRKELFDAGIRLNTQPAFITIKKREKGGISFSFNGAQIMEQDEVKALMNEFGYHNASVYFGEPNVTSDKLIDCLMGNRVYTRELVVINKEDLDDKSTPDEQITQAIGHNNWVKVSALNQKHIKDLQQRIFHELDLIRVYLKPPQGEADMEKPMILHKGDTLKELCEKIHKSFLTSYKYCMIWGPSAKHPGQRFQVLDHVLEDGDIVSIYLKRG